MDKNVEGQIILILLGLLAYYLVSTGWLSDGNGHIDMNKLGGEIRHYTIEQMRE